MTAARGRTVTVRCATAGCDGLLTRTHTRGCVECRDRCDYCRRAVWRRSFKLGISIAEAVRSFDANPPRPTRYRPVCAWCGAVRSRATALRDDEGSWACAEGVGCGLGVHL